jgi:phospholipase A1
VKGAAGRAFAVALALGCANAAAQPASTPARCHAIEDASARLACYDSATGRGAAQPPAVKPGPAPAPAESPPQHTQSLPAAQAAAPAAPLSMLDTAWDFNADSPRYDIRFYKQNYVLAARYTDRVNNQPFTPIFDAAGVPPQDLDNTEAKFQISFKGRLWATDDRRFGVWAAYTQQSHWQVYNSSEEVSKAFRETNYMPELFVSYRPGVALPGGWQWNLVNAGYTHQSNGRSQALSRSWDRLFVEGGIEKGNLALVGRAWYRLNESDEDDDNPDITDYLGHGELWGIWRWQGHSFNLGVRGNLNTGKGSAAFSYTSPPLLGAFRGYVQAFTGYGESLIDYNWRQTTIGIGVALSDGL